MTSMERAEPIKTKKIKKATEKNAYPHSKMDFRTCWLLFSCCTSKKVVQPPKRQNPVTQRQYIKHLSYPILKTKNEIRERKTKASYQVGTLVRWQRLVFPGKLCGKSEIKKIKKKKKTLEEDGTDGS
jgi:hypothetical protein